MTTETILTAPGYMERAVAHMQPDGNGAAYAEVYALLAIAAAILQQTATMKTDGSGRRVLGG